MKQPNLDVIFSKKAAPLPNPKLDYLVIFFVAIEACASL